MDMWVWSIGLFLIALAIMTAELFVPSGGVLGTLATLAIIGSLVCAFRESWNVGATMFAVEAVVVPVFLMSAVKWWPHTPIGQRVLNPPPENSDDVLPETDPRYELRLLVGKFAVAKTKMLPSGIVVIDQRSYDASGEGTAIEPGQIVRVTGVDLNRLEVRPLVPEELAQAARELSVGTATARTASSSPDDILKQPLESLDLESLTESTRAETPSAAPPTSELQSTRGTT